MGKTASKRSFSTPSHVKCETRRFVQKIINILKIKYLASLLVLFSSCQRKEEDLPPKTTLLVSLAPYQELVKKIAGEGFRVEAVVPPNANPHVYELTGRQISTIGEGVIWFRIGEPFEKRALLGLMEKNSDFIAKDLREGLILIHDHSHNGCHCSPDQEDRHLWLSPKAMLRQVETIVAGLIQKFPEKKALFEAHQQPILDDLKKLDAEIEAILANTSQRSFVVSHPAFAYFCRDYGMKQIAIEWEGKEPTVRHIGDIVQEIEQSHTKLAISIPQHSNKGLEILSKKLDLDIHTLDPYAADYAETIRRLAHLIAGRETP